MLENKTRPLGVSIISIYFWILGIMLLLLSLFFIVASIPLLIEDIKTGFSEPLAGIEIVFILGFSFILMIGISTILIARSLWKLKPAGKKVAMIISIFFILVSLQRIVLTLAYMKDLLLSKMNIVYYIIFIFSIIIFLYLKFNKNVKEAFSE